LDGVNFKLHRPALSAGLVAKVVPDGEA